MRAASPTAPPDQIAHVWRGRELAQAQESTLSSGHAPLDAQLPGCGWPVGSLVEILQHEAQQHVWQLLGPALSQAMAQVQGPAVLVDAPYLPFGPALRAQGIAAERLLCIHAQKPAARLWACEQALRCADVSAVLAWLPQVRSEELRRLHLCAQGSDKLLFVFRPVATRSQSSPARLRLLVEGRDQLQVRILKRRGPPLLQALVLQAQPRRLADLLSARRMRRDQAPIHLPSTASHVLDRTPSFAG